MSSVNITWQFEQDKLNAAIAERVKYQGRTVRTFAQIVNTALWSVAVAAQKYTTKATPAQIDTSLNVTINFVINKMGKSVPKRKPNTFSYGPGATQEVALAKLIILARADISKQGRETGRSNYNVRTNDRWRLPKEALKGGNARILEMMYKMVAARHSSSALLKAGWKPAIDILRPFIAKNDVGGVRQETLGGANRSVERLGTAIPAKEGWLCWGMIENHIGAGGTQLDEIQRMALFEYGTAPLQRALTEESEKMMLKVREYMDRDAARFNAQLR